PSDFYYVLLDSANADSSRLPSRMAVHPEKILHRYDETLAANSIEKGINSFFGIVETGIGIVTSASALFATENPGYIVDAVFNTVGTAGHYVAQDQRISHEMEEITLEKKVIQEESLRTGQIPPGKVASGFVFFPRYSDPGYMMFCFPLEDQLFQFVYHQHQELIQ
ncbi:MAG: hypothetical protein KAT15_25445, partial [Bacteroidales bacterium]|nr:hypothetical protein [Bacteroidales bacterium]